jgi:hypothetical protein
VATVKKSGPLGSKKCLESEEIWTKNLRRLGEKNARHLLGNDEAWTSQEGMIRRHVRIPLR